MNKNQNGIKLFINKILCSKGQKINSKCSTMTSKTQLKTTHLANCCSKQTEKPSKPYIGNFHETPQYMRDEKLQTGYRINFHSYSQVLKSLFQLHNQTVNIWTHFGGALIMFCIIVGSISSQDINRQIEKIPFQTFIQKYNPEPIQCNISTIKIIQQTLLPIQVEQKIKDKICHPQGKNYFGEFVCEVAVDEITLIKNYVLNNFGQNMRKIEAIKLHWEKEVIPYIFHEIEKQSNFSLFNFVKQKIERIQIRMDEKDYDYLQFGDYTDNPKNVSRFPLIFYLFCAIICLGCSSAFHLFNPMSSRAYKISISLDYAGINIFIAGSIFPALYYGMYCYFNVAYFYMTIIMLIASTLFVLSLTDWFKKPENFVLKSICYGGFAFFLLVPISHLVINQIFFHNQGDDFSFLPSIHWYILGAICNLVGLIAFTKRCPDRNNPGKFDVCGHSHQIWHTLVLMGMFFLYFGACVNYETRKQFSCPAQF